MEVVIIIVNKYDLMWKYCKMNYELNRKQRKIAKEKILGMLCNLPWALFLSSEAMCSTRVFVTTSTPLAEYSMQSYPSSTSLLSPPHPHIVLCLERTSGTADSHTSRAVTLWVKN